MLKSIHALAEFHGTSRSCGRSYGESQAEAMRTCLDMEVKPRREIRALARQCSRSFAQWERPVIEFVRGMSEGSGLTPEETMMLLLHEENSHMQHCTAVGATGPATRDGGAIIAQSWDAGPTKYALASLLRLRTDSGPATLTYTYPGLWAAAGINEHGLSLVWTSSGLRPMVPPKPGIPTFALIAGVLGCRTASEAVALVQRTRNAGSFIFFVADDGGEVWVIEAVPGHVQAVPCRDVAARANHFECPNIRRAAHQNLPRVSLKWNSQTRRARAAELLQRYRGRIDRKVIETIYRDHSPRIGLCICQHTARGACMSLDTFYAVPSRKEFWIARGHICRHEFARHRPI